MVNRTAAASFLLLAVLLLPVTISVTRGLENIGADITVELTVEGRCRIDVVASAFTAEPPQMEDFPVSEARLTVSVSSPSASALSVRLSLSADLREVPAEISGLTRDAINALISMSGIQGKSIGEALRSISQIVGREVPETQLPPELDRFVIERLECTEFSVSGRTVTGEFVLDLSGEIPENAREGLPLDLDFRISASEQLLDVSVEIRAEDGSLTMDLRVNSATGRLDASLSCVFDLPLENGIVVFRGLPEIAEAGRVLEDMIEDILPAADITLRLKVPENASVEGLPSGYATEDGQTYSWSGSSASSALLSILGGESAPSVSYVPSAAEPSILLPALAAAVVAVVIVVVLLLVRKR